MDGMGWDGMDWTTVPAFASGDPSATARLGQQDERESAPENEG